MKGAIRLVTKPKILSLAGIGVLNPLGYAAEVDLFNEGTSVEIIEKLDNAIKSHAGPKK